MKTLQKVYKLGARLSANIWGDVVNYYFFHIRVNRGSNYCPHHGGTVGVENDEGLGLQILLEENAIRHMCG